MVLLTLIPLLGYILFWQRVAKSRSSSAAIHASSAVLLALYLGAITNLLLPVCVLLLLFGSLFAIREAAILIKNKSPLPVSLGAYLIFCTVFSILHHNNTFYLYDEFAHWGIFLKEMLEGDAVWDSGSRAMVLRYPPGAPLWQYFFLRFAGFTESGAYLSQFCFLMLPLLVLWQGIKLRQIYWQVAIIALVAVALSNYGHGIASLYVDHLLAAWIAGTIFSFMLDLEDLTPRQLLVYVLPIGTIVLIKDAGLFFALAAVGTMAALVFWQTAFMSGEKRVKSGLINAGTLTFACIICAGFISLSWNANRNTAGIPKSDYSTSGIFAGIAGNKSIFSESEKTELGKRFREVILHQQISKNDIFEPFGEFNYDIRHIFTDKFRLTTGSLILFFLLWQFVVVYKLAAPGDRWRWVIVAAGLTLTTVIYIGIMFLSYQFAFGERAMILPSYLRYVHTALLPMVLFIFVPLLPGFAAKNEKTKVLPGLRNVNRPAIIFTALIAVLYIFETPHLTPLYKAHEAPEVREQMKPFIRKVKDSVQPDARVWIYLPVPDPTGIRRRIFLYEMSPVTTEVVTDMEFFSGDSANIEDVIANWDYLWFPIQDFEADEIMKSLVAGSDLKEYVFRVDRSEGKSEIVALDGVFN